MVRFTTRKKISASQKELLAIFDSISDPICMVDDDMTIRRINTTMAAMLGVDIKDAPGKICYRDILHNQTMCEGCPLLVGPDEKTAECGILDKTPESLKKSYEITHYRYPNGARRHHIIHFKDVTERVRIENKLENLNELYHKKMGEKDSQLRQSHDRFEEILSHSPMGMVILAEDGTIVSTNPRFLSIFGLSFEDVEDKSVFDVIGRKNRRQFKSFFNEVRDIGSHSITVSIDTQAGRAADLIVAGFVLSGEEKSDIILMIQDISKRLQAERALKESEATSRALLDTIVDMAFLMETDGTVIDINEKVVEKIGCMIDDIVGSKIYDLMPHHIASFRKAQVEHAIESKRTIVFEDENKGIHYRHSISPIINEHGEVERLAVFAQDITHQKLMLRELIAREALTASGRLSASMARELKKSMLGMQNCLTLLENHITEEGSASSNLRRLKTDLDNARDLLDQISLYYSFEVDDKVITDINELIENLLPVVRAGLNENNIVIETQLSSRVSKVPIYPGKFRQALLHLINNANDAMNGGGTLEISTKKRGKSVLVIIRDTGVGMEREMLDAVKHAHFMGKHGAIALGLFICKDIMIEHGGSLDISSKPEDGTKVTLSFPI
ncbi:MAG: PAS domain S-box protein [Deltaproteobacteria bacterium]|nr:PAS domain S-box protein [Candidatus Zymogenaceae bacterium]